MYYKIQLEQKELSVRGWNWGKTDFQGTYCYMHLLNQLDQIKSNKNERERKINQLNIYIYIYI